MSESYIGEIRMFAGSYEPLGWAFCDGRLVGIAEYQALFQLIGTTYGGDGLSNFALPDLRGRVPIHQSSRPVGQSGGVETVTLGVDQLPGHSHALLGSAGNGTQSGPHNNVLASSSLMRPYAPDTPANALAPASILATGDGKPHENMQPFTCLNFIISLEGIYPVPN